MSPPTYTQAGGIPQVMKILLEQGLLHGDALTISGQTIAEVLADIPSTPRADQDVIRQWDNPMYAQGHLSHPQRQSRHRRRSRQNYWRQETRNYWAQLESSESEETCLDAILAGKIKAGDVIVIRY